MSTWQTRRPIQKTSPASQCSNTDRCHSTSQCACGTERERERKKKRLLLKSRPSPESHGVLFAPLPPKGKGCCDPLALDAGGCVILILQYTQCSDTLSGAIYRRTGAPAESRPAGRRPPDWPPLAVQLATHQPIGSSRASRRPRRQAAGVAWAHRVAACVGAANRPPAAKAAGQCACRQGPNLCASSEPGAARLGRRRPVPACVFAACRHRASYRIRPDTGQAYWPAGYPSGRAPAGRPSRRRPPVTALSAGHPPASST